MSQVRADGLAAALARGMPAVVWVHGDEPLLVLEAADTVRSAARSGGAVERLVFEGGRQFRPDALKAEAGAMSLFGEGKLLELRLPSKPGKEIGQAIGEVAAGMDPAIRLLVVSPRLDRAVTDSAWFAAIDRHALVVPIYPVARQQLPQWIGRRLAQQKQRTDPDTLEFVAERVEGNLLAADQEIRKLALLFPEGDLAGADVRAAVLDVARYGAFDLVEPMLTGDAARTLRTLDGLRAEGEAGPLILWSVADALRTLMRLHEAQAVGRPLAGELRAARVFGPREQQFHTALRRLDVDTVRASLQQAALVDRMMKGLVAGDAWGALEALAITIAGVRVPVASR
ncbi:MAG: DNA polymerase III subunit delta [Limnobacter sp.]|nr:DNA polymerase III subunit delta [Limnobacter sp.]